MQKAIANGSISLHVNMKGFSGSFTEMAKRGLSREMLPHATEEEMGWIARAVANGRRSWDSIHFYGDNGDKVTVPEPDWASFPRLRDLPC
ncbi:hypothetical protein Pta02_80910 [Planobispora takensis]|uniref:Uncharacterized protein n=1 Tax=Planobispora takensis TaxID=1367882 RepID=A0A8J3WYL5_9ACTN|nr:hypothetical protein Pta02_80910 [Planobispora takensis]